MASNIYRKEIEMICHDCYLPLAACVENVEGRILTQAEVMSCPLRIAAKLKLEAGQVRQMSRVAQVRQYQPRHFIRMIEITVERNQCGEGAA